MIREKTMICFEGFFLCEANKALIGEKPMQYRNLEIDDVILLRHSFLFFNCFL